MGSAATTKRKTNNNRENKHCFETITRPIHNKQDTRNPAGNGSQSPGYHNGGFRDCWDSDGRGNNGRESTNAAQMHGHDGRAHGRCGHDGQAHGRHGHDACVRK